MVPLNPNAQRLRTIIVSFPILVVTTAILYRRVTYGEEQRKLPRDATDPKSQERIGQVGGVPWEVQGKEQQNERTLR